MTDISTLARDAVREIVDDALDALDRRETPNEARIVHLQTLELVLRRGVATHEQRDRVRRLAERELGAETVAAALGHGRTA